MEPTREIYGNIVAGELVYLFMIVSFGLVGLALYRHYRLWMQGRPAHRVQDLGRRLKAMLVQAGLPSTPPPERDLVAVLLRAILRHLF